MTNKPPEPEDDKEAEARFNETLGRLVNTPPKPHKPPELKPVRRGQKKAMPRDDDAPGTPER